MLLSEPLTHQNISLRALKTEDISAQYVQWLNDPELNQYMETRHQAWDERSIQTFVETQNASDNQLLLGIFFEGRTHIGNIKLGPIDFRHKKSEISLFIGEKAFWGRGLATQSIVLLSSYAFENLGIKKLSAGMYAENLGSLRAFLKAGFSLEGILKAHYKVDEETRTDSYLLGLNH